MSRIVCFADSGAVATTVQQVFGSHDLHMLSASHLTSDVRHAVQQFAPDMVLLELNRAMDNAHLYFFLRADQATRSIPVILVTPSESSTHQANILGADAVVSRASLATTLRQAITRFLPRERMLAA